MLKSDWETKSLAVIVVVCYAGNLLLGGAGVLLQPASVAQLMLYQIGNAFAVSGSVIAARYTGLRGQHVAASAYILLGITHGISLGALGRASVNVDRGMTMVMPMIPALLFIFWCDLYPRWLRLAGLLPMCLFTMVFIRVHLGAPFYSWPLTFGYGTLQILELVWAVYLFRDWQRSRA